MMGRGRIIALACAAALLVPASGHALDEAIGRALFRRAWVPAPSSTRADDGLGPLFNARACVACHRDLDRHPIEVDAGDIVASEFLVLRFSDAAGRPDPVYGRQMQTSAVTGPAPEGRIARTSQGYAPSDLAYGPLAPETRTGALLAPSLRGLGELASVPDDALLGFVAENARSDDGVRGRVNWVVDVQGAKRIGRFGWKASLPTLDAQVAQAFMLDIGLSTDAYPAPEGDCTSAQSACLSARGSERDGGPEIPAALVSRVTAYLVSIAPAAPVGVDPDSERLFAATGCAACHRPVLPGKTGPVRAFTDLLLHDMGPALDGGATEPGVAATEWRTAPLWGLSRTLARGAGLLHDGRAATVEDAVALHGGEAASAKARFLSLPEAERRRLVEFLKLL